MMYDIYEVHQLNDDGTKELIERVYQPSEPMYDSTALVNVIKNRIVTQTGLDESVIKITSAGQAENVGGEGPKV